MAPQSAPTCSRNPRHQAPFIEVIDESGAAYVCGLCVILLLDESDKSGMSVSLVLGRPAPARR